MNNYQNYQPDEVPELHCEDCGARIEDPITFAEGTEYEKEVKLCEKCFEEYE
jgi:hypothetical protein